MNSRKEIIYLSLYCALICTTIGGYWNYGILSWILGIVMFSLIFVIMFVTYSVFKKGVVFVYENFIKFFQDVVQEDEKKERFK